MRILWLLCLMPLVSSGQYATIRGVAPLAIGKEIQLRVYDDPVSGKERILTKQTVDADGSFELKAVTNETQYAFLQVGQNCADFFIERDKTLELTFVPPAKDPKKPEAFYERHFFTPKILGGKSAKMNEQVIQYNDSLDAFLEALYPTLVNRKSPAIVAKGLEVFEKKISKQFSAAEPFVKEYIKYSIAAVEQTFLSDRDRLFAKYLNDVKPQFNNPAYVDFLLQFHQGAVHKLAVVNRHEECKRVLAGKEAFAVLEQMLLEQEPFLEESSVRRMVLVEGMDGLFGQREFEDEHLIRALKQIAGFSSNAYLGNAAKNIAAKHEKLAKGKQAPEIVFKTVDGVEKHLSDFEGTHVFLELTDAKNGYCQRETHVIPNLKEEFKNIRFVTVCVGNSKIEMQSLQKRLSINWEFGGVEISSSLIDDYNVKSLPLFFIIDPKGKFYSVPAKDPSKGAQGELMSLSEKLKSEGRKGVGK
ncbi:MAG: redoxin domain-containing protein [Flavobacteriales bacterium]|nr:redoxin domain-containing protein [Flavobacteriales bacterium]